MIETADESTDGKTRSLAHRNLHCSLVGLLENKADESDESTDGGLDRHDMNCCCFTSTQMAMRQMRLIGAFLSVKSSNVVRMII